jgi:hypothetical protein
LEGQVRGAIENTQLAREHFNIAGGKFGVLGPRQTRSDRSDNLDYVFTPKLMRSFRHLSIFFWSKYDLS